MDAWPISVPNRRGTTLALVAMRKNLFDGVLEAQGKAASSILERLSIAKKEHGRLTRWMTLTDR